MEILESATEITAAYASGNQISREDVPAFFKAIYQAIQQAEADEPEAVELQPAVPVKKSVTPDFIFCLEDGKKFKSLKRHLRTRYDMTPEQYREKWGLPADYPMVAPNYAAARSELAKQMGLGQQRRRGA